MHDSACKWCIVENAKKYKKKKKLCEIFLKSAADKKYRIMFGIYK